MKKKPKIGRPELPENEKRQVFSIRLSADERAAIERAAEGVAMGVQDWIRAALLRAANDL